MLIEMQESCLLRAYVEPIDISYNNAKVYSIALIYHLHQHQQFSPQSPDDVVNQHF